jgi:hypothetical protein
LFDWEEPEFAMQIGTARNMKDFGICILGDCYETLNFRGIGRARWTVGFKAAQDNAFR